MLINTSTQQDRQIQDAESSDHIRNLVAIIEDMDSQIVKWKEASNCDSPEDLVVKLAEIPST